MVITNIGRNAIDFWEKMPHPQAKDDPFLSGFLQFLAAGFEDVGIGPYTWQFFDAPKVPLSNRQNLIACFTHRGVDVRGKYICLSHELSACASDTTDDTGDLSMG